MSILRVPAWRRQIYHQCGHQGSVLLSVTGCPLITWSSETLPGLRHHMGPRSAERLFKHHSPCLESLPQPKLAAYPGQSACVTRLSHSECEISASCLVVLFPKSRLDMLGEPHTARRTSLQRCSPAEAAGLYRLVEAVKTRILRPSPAASAASWITCAIVE